MRSVRAAYKDLMDGSESEPAKRGKKTAEWILEYVLKHGNDDWVVEELLKALHVPGENVSLKKMILLKRISSEVLKGSISENTLEALEAIGELDSQLPQSDNNPRVSIRPNSIQELYPAVAVECTVKHLRPEINNLDNYNAALKWFWSDRIEDTEDVEMGRWVSNKMKELKKELVAAVCNPQLRDALVRKYRKDDLLDSLKVFLRDAWNDLGSTFLDTVAEDVAKGRYNPSSRSPANVSERSVLRTGSSVSQSRTVKGRTKSAVCSGRIFSEKINDPPETERIDSSNTKQMGIDNCVPVMALLDTSKGCHLTSEEEDGVRQMELRASGNISELPMHGRGMLALQPETARACLNMPLDTEGGVLKDAGEINNVPKKAMVDNENRGSSSLGSSNGCPSLEIGVRHMIVENSVAESSKHREESGSTFAPPWTGLHFDAVINVSKERKRMTSNLREKLVCFSEMREVCVDGQNDQPLPDRNVADCQSTRINLEENEMTGHDGLTVEGTAGTDAQASGRLNLQHLDCTNNQTRLSPRLSDSHNDKQALTPKFINTQEVLRKSILDLHSHVEDPLPDALQVADDAMAVKESLHSVAHPDGKEQTENPTIEVDISISREAHKGSHEEHVHTRGTAHQNGKSRNEPLKCSIMDRNPTAHTYVWDKDDEIECPQEKSPSRSRQVHLPTPTTRQFSPLKRPRTAASIPARRRHTKWTVIEEDTLRNEVSRYGKGRWKFILEKNREIFEDRTEVDLKDKWRNIARREGLH